MHIYIDESGTFTVPATRKPSISCVAATIIPDAQRDELLAEFDALCHTWGTSPAQVKGRDLGELEIDSLVSMLAKHDVILEVVGIEMAMQTAEGMTSHRLNQAEKLTANLTPAHKPKLVESIQAWQGRMRRLPNQLYAQSVASWELLASVLRKATLYYVQRRPAELGAFHWFIDAKDKKRISEYDDLWSRLVMPALESQSFQGPLIQLRDEDYSAFERFCRAEERTPRRLVKVLGDESPFEYIDLNLVLREHLSITTPELAPGLRIADILSNAVRRAMNGNLQYLGWHGLGALMVQAPKTDQVIPLIDISFGSKPTFSKPPPYHRVIPHLQRTARQMLTDE